MGKEYSKSQTFFRVYNASQKRIYAFLLLMVHNRDDAEDLLQETAAAMWEQFDSFKEGNSFVSWGIGIARHKALDFMRANRHSRLYFGDDFYKQLPQVAEKSSREKECRLRALNECLEKLSPENKRLLKRRFVDNLGFRIISQQTGKSEASLYKCVSRIYSFLYDCIGQTLYREGYA